MKTIDDINLHTWFVDRELPSAPAHFISVKASVSKESKEWVLEKLTGRFATGHSLFSSGGSPYDIYFEDPKEATFYELKWG